ncbi:MAG TPA: polyphosphate polymerase domain-containing protein [Planctomycetota bacterium]
MSRDAPGGAASRSGSTQARAPRAPSGSERPGLRHELKFACEDEAYPRLRMALRLARSGVRPLHPPRVVQSLYLDTSHGRALAENLAGVSEREKLRLRWYGAEDERVAGILERKCRENSLGWKESVRLAAPVLVRGAERRRLVAELARQAGGLWAERLAGLEPAQWVRYRREYLTTADGRVRVTIDRELFCADQRLRARLSDTAPTPPLRLLVLELKCAPEHLAEARELAASLPVTLGRCSKFVLASERPGGPLPSTLGA